MIISVPARWSRPQLKAVPDLPRPVQSAASVVSVACRRCRKPMQVVEDSVPDRERLCNACARPLG